MLDYLGGVLEHLIVVLLRKVAMDTLTVATAKMPLTLYNSE
jgi:hypothetical protein